MAQKLESMSEPMLESFLPYLDTQLQSLSSHIEALLSNQARGFIQEYEGIAAAEAKHPAKESEKKENATKNRYRNIVAYDHSRVTVKKSAANHNSDYVNANYVNGYEKPCMYIASQGPVPDAFGGFWQMVWEQNSAVILMVTNEIEGGKLKCHRYWPDTETPEKDIAGTFLVKFLEETVHSSYIERKLTLVNQANNQSRSVTQLTYTAWPDHGVPNTSIEILDFRKYIRALNPPGSMLVVYCSAGVGRTGTYIAIDRLLAMAENMESKLNVLEVVTDLRNSRNYMVQTLVQYRFIYQAIVDGLFRMQTAAKKLLNEKRQSRKSVSDEEVVATVRAEIQELEDELAQVQEEVAAEQGPTQEALDAIESLAVAEDSHRSELLPAGTHAPEAEGAVQMRPQERRKWTIRSIQSVELRADASFYDSVQDTKDAAREVPSSERRRSLMQNVESEDNWKSRGNVPLGPQDKGYVAPEAVPLDLRVQSLHGRATAVVKGAGPGEKGYRVDAALPLVDRRQSLQDFVNAPVVGPSPAEKGYDAAHQAPVEKRLSSLQDYTQHWRERYHEAEERWKAHSGAGGEAYDIKAALTPIESRLESLHSQRESWRARSSIVRTQAEEEHRARIVDMTERLKALAETLVSADERWKKRGDGLRPQSQVFDDSTRIDTVDRMGSLYDRLTKIQTESTAWKERGSGFRGVVENPAPRIVTVPFAKPGDPKASPASGATPAAAAAAAGAGAGKGPAAGGAAAAAGGAGANGSSAAAAPSPARAPSKPELVKGAVVGGSSALTKENEVRLASLIGLLRKSTAGATPGPAAASAAHPMIAAAAAVQQRGGNVLRRPSHPMLK